MKIKKLDLFKFKDLVDSRVPFVVKFKHDGCHLCHDLKPVYKTVAAKFPELQFYDVDTNEEEDLADLFIEDGVPTLFYVNGPSFDEIDYPNDGYTEENLTEIITNILNKGKNEN